MISSDFCHWGKRSRALQHSLVLLHCPSHLCLLVFRFQYTHYEKKHGLVDWRLSQWSDLFVLGEIWQSIKALDEQGMKAIESQVVHSVVCCLY